MNRPVPYKHSFKQEIVHRCLTERCQDCSGSYHSGVLGLEILCYCTCHRHNLQEREYKDSNRLDKRSYIGNTEHYLDRHNMIWQSMFRLPWRLPCGTFTMGWVCFHLPQNKRSRPSSSSGNPSSIHCPAKNRWNPGSMARITISQSLQAPFQSC